jgi:sulfatase modifying factor 1
MNDKSKLKKTKTKKTCISKKKNDIETKMILVEGGFMPSPPQEPFFLKLKRSFASDGYSQDRPLKARDVESFLIGMHCVRFHEWCLVLDWARQNNFEINSGEAESPNHPVTKINFYDSVKWCNAKSIFHGLEPVYWLNKSLYCKKEQIEVDGINTITINHEANGYRLPTEYEWQWAALGGKASKKFTFSGANDLDKVGWFKENSGGMTHPVGLKLPNELGLFDMSGNVHEWCWSYPEYDEFYQAPCRGGSCKSPDFDCQISIGSSGVTPGAIYEVYGFRLAMNKA